MLEKSTEFRDLFNTYLVKTSFLYEGESVSEGWHQICACMDSIENVEYACKKFFELEDVSYLELYGFFQSLYIQQDAIRHLYKRVIGTRLDFNNNQVLKGIREKRNCYVGHPTGKGFRGQLKTYHGIGYHTKDFKANVWDWGASSSSSSVIDLKDINDKQKIEIDNLLTEMINKMKEIEKEKRDKINEMDIGFGFEKELFFSQFWKSDDAWKKSLFDSMKENFIKFASELEEIIGERFDQSTSLGLLISEITYCLNHFPGFDDINIGNRIYYEFLQNKTNELKELMKEVKPNLKEGN